MRLPLSSLRAREGWYNPRRRHESLGQKSLINVETERQGKDNINKSGLTMSIAKLEMKIWSVVSVR